MLEKIAALEVSVRMNYGVQVCLTPSTVLLDSLDVRFVRPFKDPVASDMVARLLNVLAYAS